MNKNCYSCSFFANCSIKTKDILDKGCYLYTEYQSNKNYVSYKDIVELVRDVNEVLKDYGLKAVILNRQEQYLLSMLYENKMALKNIYDSLNDITYELKSI